MLFTLIQGLDVSGFWRVKEGRVQFDPAWGGHMSLYTWCAPIRCNRVYYLTHLLHFRFSNRLCPSGFIFSLKLSALINILVNLELYVEFKENVIIIGICRVVWGHVKYFSNRKFSIKICRKWQLCDQSWFGKLGHYRVYLNFS